MAGHGDSEEGDFWPGYVDALTAMVKVLSFVMMLMATAVFVLSQNISKNIVQQIAEAAKVDNPGDENVSELTQRIVAKVRADSSAKTPSPPPAVKEPAPPAPAAPLVQKPEEEKPGETKVAVASETRAAPAETKETGTKREAFRLTLNFPNRQSAIDDKAKSEIEDFAGTTGLKDAKGQVLVQAMAFAGDGALSEIRRIAFYRAMLVRQKLVQSGVDPAMITVKVLDTTTADQAPQVNVLVQQ